MSDNQVVDREQRLKRKVTSILISQPKPSTTRNPYLDLAEKYGIRVDFRKFIQIQPIDMKLFRRQRINPIEYPAVIFTSKTAIESFFKICENLRAKMPQETKYFCSSETIGLYLQKFIDYRKRKVFYPKDGKTTLRKLLEKHQNIGKYLFPCASYPFDEQLRNTGLTDYLKEQEIDFDELAIYQVVCSDLSDLKDIFYDMIVFFSPLGIKSLFENFPEFQQLYTRIAAYGDATAKSVNEYDLEVDVQPSKEASSMSMAIEKYIKEVNF